MVKILSEAGVTFATLGKEEACNGDTARRLGNEYLLPDAREDQRRDVERAEGEGGHHPVPALLQHHQERVPGVRRQLPGHLPHRADQRADPRQADQALDR